MEWCCLFIDGMVTMVILQLLLWYELNDHIKHFHYTITSTEEMIGNTTSTETIITV